jgi:hypothetical protein
MNSHKLLLPLVETETENPSELSIKLYDIWLFERSQLHNNPSYDKDFALQLLDRIEQLIATNQTPDFVVDPSAKEYSYQVNKQGIHSSKFSNIKERFALDYFFVHDKCYSYAYDIELTPSDEEYTFWFSLKLRQYDLKLQKTNDFLNFQLSEYSSHYGQDFFEILSLSLLQYPDFFSDRLFQMVNVWMSKNKTMDAKTEGSLIVAQTDNVSKKEIYSGSDCSSHTITVAQIDNVKQSNINRPSRPLPKFTWNENVKRENQLYHLHESLSSRGYIGKIEHSVFKKHFSGVFENIPAINWKTSQYGLIYLINKLKPYLNPELFIGKDNTIAIAYFERHFHYKGKPINVSSWRKVKSDNKGIENEVTIYIDMIFKHL